MEIAKLIEIDGEQVVLLPKKFQLKNMDEVVVQKLGNAILLVPKSSLYETFTEDLNGFTSDIFEDGRNQDN